VAAGALILEEAGGRVTDLQGDGNYLKPPYALIAANPAIHQAIFEKLQQIK